MLGECGADINDQMRWWSNYQWPVAVGAVAACRQAVATQCEMGIKQCNLLSEAEFIPPRVHFFSNFGQVCVYALSWSMSKAM